MKKLMLFIGAMMLCNISFSQVGIEKYDEFKLAAYERPFGLYSQVLSEGGSRFFVQIESGADVSELCFRDTKEFQGFIKNIDDAGLIYEKWSNVCQKESIRFFMKQISVRPSIADVIIMQEGGLRRIKNVEIYTYFYVDKDGKCYVIVESRTPVAREKSIGTGNLIAKETFYYDLFEDYRLFGYDSSFSDYEAPNNPDSRCRLKFSSIAEIKDLTSKLEAMQMLWEKNATMSKLLNQ